MEIFRLGALPIYSWAPSLEEGALRQAVNCANLPVAFHHVAVMADGHQGYGVPVGAVLALDAAISPFAVGNDIGCGMALVPTTVTRDELLSPAHTKSGRPGPVVREDIMRLVQAAVPSGLGGEASDRGKRGEVGPLLRGAFDAAEEAAAAAGLPLSTSQSADPGRGKALTRQEFIDRGIRQAGSLGSGNHFIELLASPEGQVWLMLHSGSRGVGSLICNNFHRMALAHCEESGFPLPDPGLAWLPVGEGADRWSLVGRCYERALRAGLRYAELNRRSMLETIGGIFDRLFPGSMRWQELVNIHHNDAVREEHFGRFVWIHRKGAVKAARGAVTITPGSMGTGSFLGRGLGNPLSFSSCSHGAGRALSRSRARQELSLQRELARIEEAGGKVFAASAEAVLDEMPAAYKDLDEVMAAQSDLVQPVRRFTPLGTYKGADRPRDRSRSNRRAGKER
jgi:tRNA-splicing ligase RtcB